MPLNRRQVPANLPVQGWDFDITTSTSQESTSMSKKKKRKKNKELPSKQKPRPTPPGELKISEAILKVNEPLMARYQEPHRIKAIIFLTVMAWNISLFKGEKRIELQEEMIEELPAALGAEDVGIFLDSLEMLIERKEKMFPDVQEYILDHKVSFEGATFSLNVTAVPITEREKQN